MLRLIAYEISRDTIGVLLHLLSLAKRGQLRGLAVCYWVPGTGSRVALAGLYRQEPERALGAADLIKVRAARQLDLFS